MSLITPNKKRRKVSVDFKDDKGFTEQAHASDVKIQNIMKKYERTGIIEHNAQYGGEYANMVGALDFAEAQRVIADANSMFESVPATIRRDFDNNPAKFVDFMMNEKNREAIQDYGFQTDHLPEAPEQPLGEPQAEPPTPPTGTPETPTPAPE